MEVVGRPYGYIEIRDCDSLPIIFRTNPNNFERILRDLNKVIDNLKENEVFKRRTTLRSGDGTWFSLSLNVTYSVILTVIQILKLDCCCEIKKHEKFVGNLVQKYFEYYDYYKNTGFLKSLCYGKARVKTVEWFKSILENGE